MIEAAILASRRVLVIAPHPDDEVLGVGGTIARLADAGAEVTVAVVTRAFPPLFAESVSREGREEAARAHELLGVARTLYLDQPAAELDTVPHHRLNRALGEVMTTLTPEIVFVPFAGDIHLDHQLVFLSALVAMRPHGPDFPATVLCYETLSETNWSAPHLMANFVPNVFVDISATLERKLRGMAAFRSQLRSSPHERSIEAIRALATLRGATVHRPAAEAFALVRSLV